MKAPDYVLEGFVAMVLVTLTPYCTVHFSDLRYWEGTRIQS